MQKKLDKKKEGKRTADWFEKLKPLVDHVWELSFDLIYVLGTILSLDEIMICFMRRSSQTHWIKGEPIGEEFKLFVLAINNGFAVNFTPDGRTAAKKHEQEYSTAEKKNGKIESILMFIVEIVDQFRKRQTYWLKNYERVMRSKESNS